MFTLHPVAIDICCDRKWVLFICGRFYLLLKFAENIWCSLGLFLIYVYVSNAFPTRKGSAILHGNKFVFLTEWFSATSSHDISIMSTLFLHVGASENVILPCTGNMNIPELHTIPRCPSEQSHEKLHKVYWTHSAGLRNCFWPLEITISMRKMHSHKR